MKFSSKQPFPRKFIAILIDVENLIECLSVNLFILIIYKFCLSSNKLDV